MTYVYLSLAILAEVGWALSMKVSDGFSRPVPSIVTVILYVVSLLFLTLATKRMDISVGYALWAGSGVAIIALAGIVWLKEPVSALKVASLGLIVLGIVGLHLAGDVRTTG